MYVIRGYKLVISLMIKSYVFLINDISQKTLEKVLKKHITTKYVVFFKKMEVLRLPQEYIGMFCSKHVDITCL